MARIGDGSCAFRIIGSCHGSINTFHHLQTASSFQTSETIARILQPYSIRTAHKPISILRQLLTNVKGPSDRQGMTAQLVHITSQSEAEVYKSEGLVAMDAATASARTEVARLDFVRPFHSTFERLMLHCKSSIGLATSHLYFTLNQLFQNKKIKKVSLIDIGVTIATWH